MLFHLVLTETSRPRDAEVSKLRETVHQQDARIRELEAQLKAQADSPPPAGPTAQIYIERIQSLNKQLKKKNCKDHLGSL